MSGEASMLVYVAIRQWDSEICCGCSDRFDDIYEMNKRMNKDYVISKHDFGGEWKIELITLFYSCLEAE